MRLLPAVVVLFALARPASALEVGLDGGSTVWAGDVLEERIDAVASTGVRWVRLNFRLDAWAAVDDATPHGPDGLTWFEAYDRIVDAYAARGIAVYGLINDEAVGTGAPLASDDFVWDYVAAAIQIIDHFKDRVRVWELFNEPNDWAGGTSARMPAEWMAVLLQETYLAVKRDHAGDPCWEGLILVSGPLFSFDGTTAADYLDDVYWYGRFTKAWDYTREVTGSFPLDAVGYHLYVHQGDASLDDVWSGVTGWVDAIDAVVASHEGFSRPIWISELGWRADVIGDGAQADRLEVAYAALASHPSVAGVVWFQLQDFLGETWGVFDAEGHRRPSADRLGQMAATYDPDGGPLSCAADPDPDVVVDVDVDVDGDGDGDDPTPAGCSTTPAASLLTLLAPLLLAARRRRPRTGARRP